MRSFYDLDYIIEINERRIEELSANYQKVLERITNIILIYSAIAIFLVSVVQDLCWNMIVHWAFSLSFAVFAIFFIVSLIFTIRLLIPVDIFYLQPPRVYYDEIRALYEKEFQDSKSIGDLLKGSYIMELQETLDYNIGVFRRKNSFYYGALLYGLIAIIPYLICLGFHISK